MDIRLIGAGGISSAMLDTLCRSLKEGDKLSILDGDTFEERNASRQVFCVPGKNKAEVLAKRARRLGVETEAIPFYLQDPQMLHGADLVICAVDNNDSRLLVKEACDAYELYAFIGANEVDQANAFVYHPSLPQSPFDNYPNLSRPDGLHPGGICQRVEYLEEFPQTIWANHASGFALLSLLCEWRESIENCLTVNELAFHSYEWTLHPHSAKNKKL